MKQQQFIWFLRFVLKLKEKKSWSKYTKTFWVSYVCLCY